MSAKAIDTSSISTFSSLRTTTSVSASELETRVTQATSSTLSSMSSSCSSSSSSLNRTFQISQSDAVTVNSELFQLLLKGIIPNSSEQATKSIRYNGNDYVGALENEVPHGKGSMTFHRDPFQRKTYCGNFKNGEPEGVGTVVFHNGLMYEGEFVNGNPKGKGIMINNYRNEKWTGEFLDYNGLQKGTYEKDEHTMVTTYEGTFVDHKLQGTGTCTVHYRISEIGPYSIITSGEWDKGKLVRGTSALKIGSDLI